MAEPVPVAPQQLGLGIVKGFQAAGAIGKGINVTLSAQGVVDVAAHDDIVIGTAQTPAFAANDPISVRLINSEGTVIMVANGSVAAGAKMFQCDSGKVNDTDPGSATAIGVALTPATNDGDLVEVMTGLKL